MDFRHGSGRRKMPPVAIGDGRIGFRPWKREGNRFVSGRFGCVRYGTGQGREERTFPAGNFCRLWGDPKRSVRRPASRRPIP